MFAFLFNLSFGKYVLRKHIYMQFPEYFIAVIQGNYRVSLNIPVTK